MGHVDLAHVSYFLPDGRALLYEVSFRVGDGAKVALVGANGAGKTTLLKVIAGDIDPQPVSGRQEMLENIVNRAIWAVDRAEAAASAAPIGAAGRS